MSEISITVVCCLCESETVHAVTLPDGWVHRYGVMEEERQGFCPEHATVAEFAKDQCPGCVGGWGDCPMWDAFAYSGRKRTVGEEDFAALRRGVCPRRVNGSFMLADGVISDVDLSGRCPAGGTAFADAIEDYCRKYPGDRP